MGLAHLTEKDLPSTNKFDATAPPTVNDDVDLGYQVGSRWVDETAGKEYVCVDNTDGAAVWVETTQSGGGDMSAATYDPTNVNGDAFAMDNMVEGATNKILTTAERSAIAANTAKVSNATHTGDVTGATALTIANNAVTNAKAAQMAANTVKANATGSAADAQDLSMPASTFLARLSTGNIIAATVSQVKTLIGNFTSSLAGLVPASGGGTTNFLRADGNWSEPTTVNEKVQARRTTAFAVPIGTPTVVSFDTTEIESNSAVLDHDAANPERIYIRQSTYVLGFVNFNFTNGANGTRIVTLELWKNGTTMLSSIDFPVPKSESASVTRSLILPPMTANDYITIRLGASNNLIFLDAKAVVQAIQSK